MTEFPNPWLLARSLSLQIEVTLKPLTSEGKPPALSLCIYFHSGFYAAEAVWGWTCTCPWLFPSCRPWNIVKSSDVGLDCNIPKPTEKWGQADQHRHHRLSLHFHRHKGHGKYWKYWKNNYKYLTCPCGGMNTWNHKPHNLLKIMSEKWEEYSVSWEIQRYPWLLPDS